MSDPSTSVADSKYAAITRLLRLDAPPLNRGDLRSHGRRRRIDQRHGVDLIVRLSALKQRGELRGSIAGRVAWNGDGVYNLTKFGVNKFTEALRQEVTQRHVRIGVLEPGGVATELGSHNRPEIRDQMIDPFYQQTEVLAPEDIADGVAYMITRPRHTAIGELWITPTDQIRPHPGPRESAKSPSKGEPFAARTPRRRPS